LISAPLSDGNGAKPSLATDVQTATNQLLHDERRRDEHAAATTAVLPLPFRRGGVSFFSLGFEVFLAQF
jgi:hypothetical protein